MSGHVNIKESSMDLIMEELQKDSKAPAWLRAFIGMSQYFDYGVNLRNRDYDDLEAWCRENAPQVNPEMVQVVSFSHEELAHDVFGGTRGSARNAIRGMESKGLICKVKSGVRARSTLYIVLPLPTEREAQL